MEERIVYVKRVDKNDKTRLPKDLLNEAKFNIGPSYDKFGQILKGINGEEERKIMPHVIGIDTNDNTFQKKVEQFWCNITIMVKPTGTKLNITLDKSGMPVAPFDYVKYKFAIKHKHVVASEDELENNPYALYYIYDPVTASRKKANELGIRNEAKLKYLEIIQDTEKMDAIIAVITNYKNPSILTDDDKKLILEDEASKRPKQLVAAANDEKIFIKAFIYKCINAGVFIQSGNRIMYDDSILGEDIDSATAFLKSKDGSKHYVTAEGKLNQWLLNK